MYERMYGPLGQVRDDHLTSMIAAAIRNSQVDKPSKALPPEKFMPRWLSASTTRQGADANGDDPESSDQDWGEH